MARSAKQNQSEDEYCAEFRIKTKRLAFTCKGSRVASVKISFATSTSSIASCSHRYLLRFDARPSNFSFASKNVSALCHPSWQHSARHLALEPTKVICFTPSAIEARTNLVTARRCERTGEADWPFDIHAADWRRSRTSHVRQISFRNTLFARFFVGIRRNLCSFPALFDRMAIS
jgi:hypothetical protein